MKKRRDYVAPALEQVILEVEHGFLLSSSEDFSGIVPTEYHPHPDDDYEI